MKEEAARLRARGFGVVWLLPGEKNPTRKGWTKATQEPDDYTPGANLGILTGAMSGNLVCVDLDSPDAVRLADAHLPQTGMIDGRASKPRSHRYYRVADIPAEEISTAASGIGGPRTRRFAGVLDLLGTGSQATAPPSVVKGEVRAWVDPDGEPATVTHAELRAGVDSLVAAAAPTKRPVGRPPKAAASVATLDGPSPALDAPDAANAIVGGPSTTTTTNPSGCTQLDDARAWMAKRDPAVSGKGGRHHTFTASLNLVNGFALDASTAWPILLEWNTRNAPPWSEDELRVTLDNAARRAREAPNPNYPRGWKLLPPGAPWCDPARLAREFTEEATWRFWNGIYWRYTGTRYEPLGEDDITDALTQTVEEASRAAYLRMHEAYKAKLAKGEKAEPAVKPRVGRALVADVFRQLRPLIRLSTESRLDSWLTTGQRPQLLAVQNGLLDTDTLTLSPHSPHSPNWFSRNCLPVAYDPEAKCGRWDASIAAMLDGDTERIDLLQQWFGYVLHRGHESQKLLAIHGGGGTGKSTTLAALRALVGEGNYSTVRVEDFGDRFSLAGTLGMLANLAADTSQIERSDEGPLKSFSVGEAMEFEKKYADAFTATPTAKLVFATNALPKTNDKTEGMFRRYSYLRMSRVVSAADRVPGMDREDFWRDETAGILNWSLAGLRRLRERKWEFTVPATSREDAAEHRADCDSAFAFLYERYAINDAAEPLPMADLYAAYGQWCAENNNGSKQGMRSFCKSVRAAYPAAREGQDRCDKTKKNRKCWRGLRAVESP